MNDIQIQFTGDTALSVTFPGVITVENNRKVRSLQFALERENIHGIVELVPTYCSLMIHYDPLIITYKELEEKIRENLQNLENVELPAGTVTEIPVLYGGRDGPDLEEVATFEGITPEEVIRRHSSQECFIYMIAFTPGLPYIGSPEKTFTVPRRPSPRVKLPMGSVTIWESQTTVFPVEQPGGWNVIGRTPIHLFDKDNQNSPFLLRSGHWVRFRPVTQEEYDQIEQQISQGTYRPVVYEKQEGV